MLRVNSALRGGSPAEAPVIARDMNRADLPQRRESVGYNGPRDGTACSSNSWGRFIGRRLLSVRF
jgi:hypothetical protein